jgi:hypothetical protein
MRGRPAERYTTIREFGAVGNGLCYALGVAAARRPGRDGKVVRARLRPARPRDSRCVGHPKLFADFAAQSDSELWNSQISDQVTAPVMSQTLKRGHGNM